MAHVTIVNDGDCWVCTQYGKFVNLKKSHTVEVKNARTDHEIVAELWDKGYDINKGVVVIINGIIYQGVDAAREIDRLSNSTKWYQKFYSLLLHSRLTKWIFYPLMTFVRRISLKRKNKPVHIPTIHPPMKKQKRKPLKDYSLVLGGGSAKGIIHIGVIKELLERKWYPKEVIGTSMGAIIGAAFALGMDAEYLHKMIKEFTITEFADVHVGQGLFKGGKVFEYLNMIYGNRNFEDCVIPLKVVTTDIETGEMVVIEKGNIASAVRASMGLPGLFEPYKYMDRVLVDGGLIANLPVGLAEANKVVAVSTVGNIKEIQPKPTSLFTLENVLSYFKANKWILTKSIGILLHQNEILSMKKTKKDVILIQPNMTGYDFGSFGKYEELIDLGYIKAKKVFDKAAI